MSVKYNKDPMHMQYFTMSNDSVLNWGGLLTRHVWLQVSQL